MIRVGIINVPVKVGPRNWLRCWTKMADRTSAFGVNETLTRKQRAAYVAAAAARGWGHYGLRTSPNPIFYNRLRWKKVRGSGQVVRLHDVGPWVRLWPGHNSARYATVVVLERRRSKRRHAFICTHLVSNGTKNLRPWREEVRATSLDTLRELVTDLTDTGCVTWVLGDMNIADPFPLGRRHAWVRGHGIDKIGVSVPDEATVGAREWAMVPAPTDHKNGVIARVEIAMPDHQKNDAGTRRRIAEIPI